MRSPLPDLQRTAREPETERRTSAQLAVAFDATARARAAVGDCGQADAATGHVCRDVARRDAVAEHRLHQIGARSVRHALVLGDTSQLLEVDAAPVVLELDEELAVA